MMIFHIIIYLIHIQCTLNDDFLSLGVVGVDIPCGSPVASKEETPSAKYSSFKVYCICIQTSKNYYEISTIYKCCEKDNR